MITKYFRVKHIINYVANLVDYVLYLMFNVFKFKRYSGGDRVLVVETLEVGDLIAISPTLKLLHERGYTVDLLIHKRNKEIYKHNPHVSKQLYYEDGFFSLLKKIRSKKYDLGVILHAGTLLVSLLLFLGRVRFRIGTTIVGALTAKGFFLHRKLMPMFRHVNKVIENLSVLSLIDLYDDKPATELYIPRLYDTQIKRKMMKIADSRRKIVIHPFGSEPLRSWPNSYWVFLCEWLVSRYNAQIFFTGAPKDKAHIDSILSDLSDSCLTSVHSFVGKTKLGEYFAVIKHADFIISVDTSAAHVAAAFDKRGVALFGETDPDMWSPFSDSMEVICLPPTSGVFGVRRPMCEISVDMVKEKVEGILG